jgi:hypothetical protein
MRSTPPRSTKIGWGHSSAEYAVKLAQHAQVKRLALTHHDPLRDDEAVDRVLAGIRDGLQTAASPLQVFAAVEGEIVEVQPSPSKPSECSVAPFSSAAPIAPALAERSVLLGVGDPSMAGGAFRGYPRRGHSFQFLLRH